MKSTTRDRIFLLLILTLAGGITVVNVIMPGLPLPAVLYALPLLVAAYLFPPSTVTVVAAFVLGAYLLEAVTEKSPIWTTSLFEIGLVFTGYLAAALSTKARRERALQEEAENLARERNQVTSTLQTLIDTIPAGILLLDASGAITSANPTANRLLGHVVIGSSYGPGNGYSLHRVDGTPFPSAELPFTRAVEGGETVRDMEILVRREDGTEKIILASAAPVLNLLGYVAGGVAVFQDISLHRLAERTLWLELENRKELETIVDKSPAMVFLWRASDGWPVEFVSGSVTQLGYTPEDFNSGRVKYAEIIHPDDRDRVISEVSSFTREGRTEFSQQYRVLTKSGEVRWLDDHTRVRRNPRGKITHYQGIVLDVTDRKRP